MRSLLSLTQDTVKGLSSILFPAGDPEFPHKRCLFDAEKLKWLKLLASGLWRNTAGPKLVIGHFRVVRCSRTTLRWQMRERYPSLKAGEQTVCLRRQLVRLLDYRKADVGGSLAEGDRVTLSLYARIEGTKNVRCQTCATLSSAPHGHTRICQDDHFTVYDSTDAVQWRVQMAI